MSVEVVCTAVGVPVSAAPILEKQAVFLPSDRLCWRRGASFVTALFYDTSDSNPRD